MVEEWDEHIGFEGEVSRQMFRPREIFIECICAGVNPSGPVTPFLNKALYIFLVNCNPTIARHFFNAGDRHGH